MVAGQRWKDENEREYLDDLEDIDSFDVDDLSLSLNEIKNMAESYAIKFAKTIRQ